MNRARFITEKELQSVIRQYARLIGWTSYHTHDSRKSEPGFPDLVLVSIGRKRVIFAELKSARGKLTVSQRWWIDALKLAGMDVHVWRPEDWTSGLIEKVLN